MPEYEQTNQWFRKSSIGMTYMYAFCTILVMLVSIFSFVTKTKFRPNMKTSTLGALLYHKVCKNSRGMQAHRVNPVFEKPIKSATYNMLNQNWLSVGCECVLYIFSLYVSKLALNMFSLWQIYYSKYTFYMQIEACDLQIFVGFRGALPPWPHNQGFALNPTGGLPPPGPPCSYLVSPNVGISALANSFSHKDFRRRDDKSRKKSIVNIHRRWLRKSRSCKK